MWNHPLAQVGLVPSRRVHFGDYPPHLIRSFPVSGRYIFRLGLSIDVNLSPQPHFYNPMTDSERTALRVLIDLKWAETRDQYQDAGQPFGQGRGLEIWIEFDQQTTIN